MRKIYIQLRAVDEFSLEFCASFSLLRTFRNNFFFEWLISVFCLIRQSVGFLNIFCLHCYQEMSRWKSSSYEKTELSNLCKKISSWRRKERKTDEHRTHVHVLRRIKRKSEKTFRTNCCFSKKVEKFPSTHATLLFIIILRYIFRLRINISIIEHPWFSCCHELFSLIRY